MKAERGGFTIIETMLVFAISAAFMAALLVGISAQVNHQRYVDTTASLQTFFQDQYSRVVNVQNANGETNPRSCSISSSVAFTSAVSNSGTSECLIMGRKLTVEGDKIKTVSIIGATSTNNVTAPANDIEAFKAYKYSEDTAQALPNDSDDYSPEWGARIVPKTATDLAAYNEHQSTTLYILRSPRSGTIYTFISSQPNATIEDTIAAGDSLSKKFILCINSLDTNVGVTQFLQLNAGASNPDGVNLQLAEDRQC